ncbi:MAG: sulfatase, partial [Verrucomicrobiota bacterium]
HDETPLAHARRHLTSVLLVTGCDIGCFSVMSANRFFIWVAWVFLVGVVPVVAKDSRPNILLFLVDDLGRHQVGCYGSEFYETPHIDRLAEQGMRFTHAYAAAAVCSPTRASIMTGKYPARLHLTDYIPGRTPQNRKLTTPMMQQGLPLDEVTIAESLKSAGYATGHFGKWHLNKDKKYELGRPGDPGSQGFDDVFTTHKPKAGPPSRYENDWHHVREITERATRFIEVNREKPFFCFVTHNSIHDPEIERPELIAKYEAKEGAQKKGLKNPRQAAMLDTLDKSFGTLMQTLKTWGLEDNTLVIFFSDNGQLGPKNGTPFRGSKGDLYEAGIRMPLIARWPGVIAAKSLNEELVISNDFFATFQEVAGIPVSGSTDGVSLYSLLRGQRATLSREALFWHYPHYHGSGIGPQGAIRKGDYKLVEWFEKSAFGEPGAFELYDLSKDPGEANDLAEALPEVVAELTTEMEQWRKSVNAQMMEPAAK